MRSSGTATSSGLALARDPTCDTVTLNPGDAVLWTADLVHAPVTGSALVAHLCPVRVQPSWFAYRPERARHAAYADGTAWIATQHYDLLDAVTPEEPPIGAQQDLGLERVEDALRNHDQDTTAPVWSGGRRRSGGLLNSVRGLMNRRDHGD